MFAPAATASETAVPVTEVPEAEIVCVAKAGEAAPMIVMASLLP
jgi:hypothetical protein